MLNFTLSPGLVRWLYNIGSISVFGFTVWYFIYQRPGLDYNELLSVLIGAQVTVVTVMFSAVLVALQLASAQFSPRITRAFFRYNPVSQSAFYAFLLGITVCFATKLTYQHETGTFTYTWAPVAAAAYCFFLLSVVLPRFVFHIADSINVAAIIQQVAERTLREIDLLYGTRRWESGDALTHERAQPKRSGIPVLAEKSGFLDIIQWRVFRNIAQKYSTWNFYIEPVVGNFITPGEALLIAEPPAGEHPLNLPAHIETALKQCFVVSRFRNYEQDITFGARQLVDIAIKAISPAVNDPTTAVNCLQYLGIIITRQAQVIYPAQIAAKLPPNIHFNAFSFASLVNLSFDQIYQWGKGDPVIVSKILEILTTIVVHTDNPHCLAVLSTQAQEFEIETLRYSTVEENTRVKRHWHRLKTALTERNV